MKIVMIFIAFLFASLLFATDFTVTSMPEVQRKSPPEDVKNIPFGTVFSDHMFVMKWNEQKGWHEARIEPYHAFTFDPASLHLHYGTEIFEGMKAFKNNQGKVVLFRPGEHLKRMNRSAVRMMMPEIDASFAEKALKRLLQEDKRWVPSQPGTSLYIRPTMIASQNTINLVVSNEYLFYIIMSPVGALYSKGFKPTAILVSDQYTRSSIGGVGDVKTGGNYAASMKAQSEAKKAGYDQVLWLDPVKRQYVEEVGSMNIFFVINGKLVTPELTGTILPGITRQSVLELSRANGWKVVERKISIQEVIKAIKNGSCTEIFGTGTAAVISSIGKLKYKDREYSIASKPDSFTLKIYETITGIQQGRILDTFRWISEI